MNKEFNSHIIGIKSLKNKAEIWIYEWLMAYVFLLTLLIFLAVKSAYIYWPSIGLMFIVITILTIKLIAIEKYRINDYDEILKYLEEEKINSLIKKKEDIQVKIYQLEDMIKHVEYINKSRESRETKEIEDDEIIHILRYTLKVSKSLLKTFYKIKTNDKSNY